MRVSVLAAATTAFLSCPSPASAEDYAGFWKGTCTDPFGISIKPAADRKYSISFCGPGGCGPWKPNTMIDGDPLYRVIDAETLEVRAAETEPWRRFRKCTADTNPKLEFPKREAQAQASPPAPPRGDGIRIAAYYKGLPDYEKNPVFKTDAAELHRMLRAALPKTRAPLCVRGRLEADLTVDPPVLKSNLCEPGAHAKVKDLLRQIAPSLDPAKLTFRTTDLDGDGEPELLVEFIDLPPAVYQIQRGGRLSEEVYPIPGVTARDPYLSLWLLKFDGSAYRATYAGPFLVGEVHAEAPFGQVGKPAMVFVRHQSCTGCHASVYQSVVDFFRDDGFEFSYDEAHRIFAPAFKYSLAGKGHTVDAAIESRVLPASPNGPHLMQQFRLDDGEVEWWVFRCVDLKCDYELHLGALPAQFRRAWETGRKL